MWVCLLCVLHMLCNKYPAMQGICSTQYVVENQLIISLGKASIERVLFDYREALREGLKKRVKLGLLAEVGGAGGRVVFLENLSRAENLSP